MKRAGISVLLCLTLCGCSWRDAGDLSPVTAGAITREDSAYTLTAELAVPNPDSAVPQSITTTGTAASIAQAIDNAGAGRDAQLYWSHARILLLGTDMLRGSMQEAVHALTVSSEVRPSVRLCAVKNAQADTVLTACASVSGDPPGFALGDSIDLAVKQSQTPDMPLYRVLDRVESDGIDPILPAVSIEGEQAVLDGAALFSGDVLCGWLDEAQTGVLCLLMQAGDTATVYDGTTRYKLSDIDTVVSADASDTPAFTINVTASLSCEDKTQAQQAAEVLRLQCMQVIQALQETGCDALSFGRTWAEQHSSSDIDWRAAPVTVRVTLRGTQSAEGGSR